MTIVIGFHCLDGVVIATDSAMTVSAGNQATAEMKGQKLFRLTENIMFAFAGTAHTAERARRFLECGIEKLVEDAESTEDLGDKISEAMELYFNNRRLDPISEFDVSLLLGVRHSGNFDLIEFGQGFRVCLTTRSMTDSPE